MAALTMPEIDDGPLRDLLLELHRLHARAGRPSTRKIAGAVGMSHTTVHGVFVSGQLPGLPGLLKIAGYLAGRDIRGAGSEDVLDRVDRLWMAADRQSGTAIVQPPGAYRSEPFTLGPMKSTLLIVEGDGELPIAREDVRLVISKQMVDVPDEVAEWRDAIAREQDRIRESGREPMWNGSGYAVDYVLGLPRAGCREPPRLDRPPVVRLLHVPGRSATGSPDA